MTDGHQTAREISSRAKVFKEAREAWEWHKTGLGWLKWIAVGRGLQECRAEAMESTQTTDVNAYRFRKVMGSILKREGLDVIDDGDRSKLLDVMDNLPAITAWLETLPTTDRVRYNHPRTVLRRWEAATKKAEPKEAEAGAEVEAEPAPPQGIKAKLQAAQDANSRLSQENIVLKQQVASHGDGELFKFTDPARTVARVLVGQWNVAKAREVIRAMTALIKEKEARLKAGGQIVPTSITVKPSPKPPTRPA